MTVRLSHRLTAFSLVLALDVTAICRLSGAAELIVYPADLEKREGGRVYGTRVPALDQSRHHWLYPPDAFPAGTHTITEIRFRADSATPPDWRSHDFGNLKITLSTTTATSLNTRFADNLVEEPSVVFDDPVVLATPFVGGPPYPFDYAIPFNEPFEYTPDGGEGLLLEFINSIELDRAVYFDAHSGSALVGTTADATQGFFVDFRPVTQFVLGNVTESACDFSGDGACDTTDIDQLMNEIAAGTNGAAFDLNIDGAVNDEDRDEWLAQASLENGFAKSLLLGDADLDGSVNSNDLNVLALNWRQENTHAWTGGNFTGAAVDAADLNALALNWRKSVSMASKASAPVPEPSAFLLSLVGLALIWKRARRR